MTEHQPNTGVSGQPSLDNPEPDSKTQSKTPRRPVVSTGNPQITIAFPFSKVEIREPANEIRDLAAMVWALADQVAALASQTAPGQADAADELAAQAALLARRLGAGSRTA